MNRSDLKRLLDFGYNEDRCFGFSKAGFNTERYNKNLGILRGVNDKLLAVMDALNDDEIKKLLLRLHKFWKEEVPPESVDLTLMEARSVGYGLTDKTELDFLRYLIKVEEIKSNWTPSCLKGFLHSVLRLWHVYQFEQREIIWEFISRNTKKDDQGLGLITPFISDGGPSRLGTQLRARKLSWRWAPPSVLIPTSRINYPYFSDVLFSYFKDVDKVEYVELRSALAIHNQTRTDKILLPHLILNSTKFNKDLLDIASKRIGDPFDESLWAPFEEANAEQRKNLQMARKKLLGWVMQEVVRMFFEVLCHDKERRLFWYNHAHKVSDFTVFGSSYSKYLAQQNLPIQNVSRHFRLVDSSVENCALAMYIGEYVIIEFTHVGALYAYKKGSENYKKAFRYASSLSKVDELKIDKPQLLYDLNRHRFSSEGKMDHRGEWRRRMNNWIRLQVGL